MSEQLPPTMYQPEQDIYPRFFVTQVCQGFEFGHGTISGQDDPEVLARVDDTLLHDPEILVSIDRDDSGDIIDDDGCGDGRGVATVFSGERKFKTSLNRAKVFGGSVTMATAARIGLNESSRENLNDAFNETVDVLIDENIDFGAHTDEQAHGENCGCGAIDKAPQILFAVAKYEFPIRGVISFLGIDMNGIDEVYKNFRSYATNVVASNPEYAGSKVMDRIISESKVVKQLRGDHKEKRILLNLVEGYTVNQQLVRERTDDKAQIFAVDVWRLESLAREMYRGDKTRQHKALLGELIYTLATAAVLTKGDLPVYLAQPGSQQPA